MLACLAGSMREADADRRGREDTRAVEGKRRTGFQNHIEGCLTEIATAKAFRWYWHPKIGEISKGDVRDIEVRSQQHAGHNHVVLKNDPDDKPVVSIVPKGGKSSIGKYILRGWIFGHEGKVEQYHQVYLRLIGKSTLKGYLIPASKLRAMSTLRGWRENPARFNQPADAEERETENQ